MAEELQGLLNRIHEEGVKKADDEKEKIISDAKAGAAKIVKEAEAKAEDILKKAKEDAQNIEQRAKASVSQAARDIMLSLKSDLQNRLEDVARTCTGKAMTPEFMGKIIMEMVKNYSGGDKSSHPSIEVLINKKDLEEMEKLLKGAMLENLKEKPEISIGHDFNSGLKIGFKGSDVFFDFTDDVISALVCSFVSPRIAEILKPQDNK